MGNSQQGLASSNVINHLSKRFVISPHPLDPQQTTMFYLHEKLSDNKYILKIISTNDSDEKQKIQDLICKKLAMNKNVSNKGKNHTSLIPIDYYLFQQDKGYCNLLSKCYLIFDLQNSQPLSHYLVRETYSQNNSNRMSEQIVYRGLLNLIEGVALLRFYNHPHRHINCDTVYYDKQQSALLLADPWISPLTDLQQQYHSPQKLLQMKNQIQKHDPYLADLFSIGMVGLKILGHHNLLEYYTIHKTIDQRGLTRLAQSIKNVSLRTLIMRLLSQNTTIRNDVLTQVKNNSSQIVKLRDSQTSGTKTRNLSGKVASVRKSFVNQTRPISKQYFVIDNINNQNQSQYQNIVIKQNANNLQNYTSSKIQIPLQTNAFIKLKQPPQLVSHSSLKNFPTTFQPPSIVSNPPFKATTTTLFNMQLMNDKPDIDIGITKNKIQTTNKFNTNINPTPTFPNSAFTNPPSTISSYAPQFQNYPSSSSSSNQYQYANKNRDITFFNKPPANIPSYTYNNVLNINRKPITGINYNFSKNEINNNTDNYQTNSIINLLDSKSDKILKNIEQFNVGNANVNQNPINPTPYSNIKSTSYSPLYSKSQIKKSQIYIVNSSTNQILPVESLSNSNNFNMNSKIEGNWFISPQLPLPLHNLSPSLSKQVIIQHIDSLPEQSMEKQKQSMATPNAYKKQHNLRTNPSFPSSQSFETDNLGQNKIYQNFKNLQNKISQVVNQSALHSQNKDSYIKQRNIGLSELANKNIKSSDIRPSDYSSNNNNQKYHESESKMIQSFILPKSQQASSHSTINLINQQMKQINKNTKIQKHSPILVRQSDQAPSHLQKYQDLKKYSDSYQNQNQNHDKSINHSVGSKQSVDFLNLNMSKQSSDEPKQSPNLSMQFNKKIEQEQKVQQILTTPNKQPSAQRLQRLQGNNLTIPEQSDEQSIEQTSNPHEKVKGDYVEQVYENGGKYIGYMLNNQRNGNGIFYYRDGGYYDGRWKNNMMNGYGKLFYQTGKLAYEGQWYQDQFHGRGIVYNDQPQSVPDNGFDYRNMNDSQNYWLYYQGDLSHDMKARYGKLTLSNGQYYEGEFKNDQVNGKGLFHRFDGVIVKGIWSQGVFIKQL